MWDVKGTPLSVKFENWVPDRVLYDFDGPRIFTVRHELGDFLAYACDEDDEITRYLLAPTSGDMITALERGTHTMREALDQPWLWVMDVGFDDVPRQVWRSTLEAIPETRLPKPWAMLWPHLEPLLAVRMVGPHLARGQIPASVIKRAIEGATYALKKLAELMLSSQSQQPDQRSLTLRRFYDLPTQHLAFNSFEIAFRARDAVQLRLGEQEGVLEQEYDEMGRRLAEALEWATLLASNGDSRPIDLDLLDALKKLVPPQTGLIEQVEVRGRLLRHQHRHTYTLSRDATQRVGRARTQREPQATPLTATGLIEEFDKGRLTFILRYTDKDRDINCAITDELYDEVMELFQQDEVRTTIFGLEIPGNRFVEVIHIARMIETSVDKPLNPT
ncbi:MAG: hypothetical protein RKO66_08290 [Candidatus Contendobacter sp.]|nr:hypothetical protein [Candidatus Contendobacter sp.]MDS4058898.1 hypothetical protein [Candidatus Contendobacter sp.]